VTSFTDEVAAEIKTKGVGKVFSLGGIRFYECPLTAITAETYEILRVVFLLESSGQLFFDGGWADQPSWLVEAYEIYKIESSEYMKGRKNAE